MNNIIYKILKKHEWQDALKAGIYKGSSDDMRDGFIHFSTADQMVATAGKFFKGQDDLVLVAIDEGKLDKTTFKYEGSSQDNLYPHLYGHLDVKAAVKTWDLPLDHKGLHMFPVINLQDKANA